MKLNSYLKIIVSVLVYLIVSLPIVFAQELNLQYDAVGNLVTGDSFYREYDGFNHLIRIRQGNSSSGNISEEFIWHPLEERVFVKKIYWNNQSLRATIKYLNKNTIKIKNESGTYYENYIYQDDILVAQRDANGNKQAVHNDHLGSVNLITDASGNVVENSFFSPFGEQITPVTNSRFSFTGKEFDSITGQYDFMSRMTKPEWANRFIQVDRIFYDFTKYEEERIQSYYDPQLLNPYVYARNNPYRLIDKTGEFVKEVFASGVTRTILGAITLIGVVALAAEAAPIVVAAVALVGIYQLSSGIATTLYGAVTPEEQTASAMYNANIIESPAGLTTELYNTQRGERDTEEEKLERLKKANLGYDLALIALQPDPKITLDYIVSGISALLAIGKVASSSGGGVGGSKSNVVIVGQKPDGTPVWGLPGTPYPNPPPTPPPSSLPKPKPKQS